MVVFPLCLCLFILWRLGFIIIQQSNIWGTNSHTAQIPETFKEGFEMQLLPRMYHLFQMYFTTFYTQEMHIGNTQTVLPLTPSNAALHLLIATWTYGRW